MMNRLFIEPDDSFEEGLTATIDRRCSSPVCLSVAEEQAVDSYNKRFSCSIHLTVEKAMRLRDWLDEAVGSLARKPSLADDPRYAKVRELAKRYLPPEVGAFWVIPRCFYLEAGFTDEEINERHSLGRNFR
jgi:hypothetical protein